MSQKVDRSLAEIRQDTERSRAALTSSVHELKAKVADTADEWRNRISPEAIKSDVKDYISTRTNDLRSTIVQSAKDNPLQALAIATGAAIPALKLVRSIPMPMLLIGAGLFFSQTKKGQELSAQAQETMSDMTSAATRQIHDLQGDVGEAVNTGLEAIESAKSTISDKAQTLASDAAELKERTMSAAHNFGQSSKSDATGAGAASDRQPAFRSASSVIQANPLLVAGIGLAVGGFIASLLPKSDAEQNILGSASEKLRDQAHNAVVGAVDTARNAAVEAFDGLTNRAAEHGLSPQGLSDAAADMGQRVRKVTEAASDAALGPHISSTSKQEPQR